MTTMGEVLTDVADDVASDEDSGLQLFANFKLAIQTMTEKLDQQVKLEKRRIAALPNYVPLSKMSVITNATTDIQDFGGPQAGRIWIVRLLVATPSPISFTTSSTPNQASNTFGAAATGSVSLPAGGFITGFDINFLPAAANVTGIVTVTNVSGGTMSYEIGIGTGGGGTDLPIRYPAPLPAASSGVAPTVNVPAIVGGPAYSITVYGQTVGGTSAVATWYVGQVMNGPAAGQLPQTMARWQFTTLPSYQNFTSNVIEVLPNERLVCGLTGLSANANTALTAVVLDQPLYAQRYPVAVE